MKVREKYKSLKGSVFEITSITSSGIVLKNTSNSNLFKYSLNEFNQAISDKKISLVKYKSKQKVNLESEFLTNYIKERNEIIDAENRDKAT